ncbi:kelch-like protein 2 [Acyrthosiphon pisum]|uniref:Kelch-like protein diablo n=1 Tax=Acyrthosiphon pisum TaxID=7029 RepID=A0A8R2NLH5_ACYPI|nr:kelch-like protein 2 [Acyrthosiphon pisum]|eukprot:XP_016657163.1 PREDICTED: kelch-like protein 2 [Acyrthosiphon pisum]
MSVKEMDTIQASSSENNLKEVLKSNDCEPTHFRNNSHSVRILEDLQSLRKNEVLCDARFKTDDGKIVIGHKNVLIAASPYFRAMFNNFDESNKDIIHIRELDSTILQLLIDYVYTGEIMVTQENVQVLLPASHVLQLDFVNRACAEFLQKQLDVLNCIAIKKLADLHNCTELMSSSEAYIKQNILEVIKGDDFLSLSCEDLGNLISCNDLAVPFEEKVFDCVIKWVRHDLDQRKNVLPQLMEHVRLPLLRPDILDNVVEEPLLNNCPKCRDYVFEAMLFHLKKSVQQFTMPKTISYTPRQFGGSQKVILMFIRSDTFPKCCTEWYDPVTNLRENAPGINECRQPAALFVIRDKFVFSVGGKSKSVFMLDVSLKSPSWVPMANMLVSRDWLGVGVLGDSIYAVGGYNCNTLDSVEVGGSNRSEASLKSVEYYDPTLEAWTPVAEMSVCRRGAGVGVLNGLMYAVGGHSGHKYLKSVEVYRSSDGVWSSVADMETRRMNPVVALNGLLYVMGGKYYKSMEDTVEIYNPNTNTWTMERLSRNRGRIYSGVVVDRPPNFIN